MNTLEIVAPTGQTLTASLYVLGTDVISVSDIELTERTNSLGVYIGTFSVTGLEEGIYRVVVFDGEIPIVVTTASISGEDGQVVYASDFITEETLTIISTVNDIKDKLIFQVPEGPVVSVPAPVVGQTVAWTYCHDQHGLLERNVKIEVKLVLVPDPRHQVNIQGLEFWDGAWDGKSIITYSDANGLASVLIPRKTGLRFAVRRGLGSWVQFNGVDAETLEMPAILGN